METPGSGSFVNLQNETSDVLSFTAQSGDNDNLYRAIFTNAGGRTITKAVRLIVT